MYEVRNDMGIEMNYKNTDKHVAEEERNNRVMKRGFRLHNIDCPIKIYQGL